MEGVNGERRGDVLRHCIWPDCRSSYDVRTGPAVDGWTRVTVLGGVICPVHSGLGHLPDVERVAHVPPFRAHGWVLTCECSLRTAHPRFDIAGIVADWHEHLIAVVSKEAGVGS